MVRSCEAMGSPNEDAMTGKHIKSGADVVTDFLASLADSPELDKNTVEVIRELHSIGKLTKTRLPQALADKRNSSA